MSLICERAHISHKSEEQSLIQCEEEEKDGEGVDRDGVDGDGCEEGREEAEVDVGVGIGGVEIDSAVDGEGCGEKEGGRKGREERGISRKYSTATQN